MQPIASVHSQAHVAANLLLDASWLVLIVCMASSSPGGWSDLDSADGAGSAEWEALHDSDGSPADAAGQNARTERDAWDGAYWRAPRI